MITLFESVSITKYTMAVANGYIKTQTHPTAPYTIHNYTDACTWDQAWDEATLNCRGLITDNLTGAIIARGMPKFFNSDQEQAPQLALNDEVFVAEKMDGSLGVLYRLPNGEDAIATRGSFASDQAIWATKWWNENKPPFDIFDEGETIVFEIIYPDNRIVVDYGDKQGLVLLGAVNNRTGRFSPMTANDFDHAPWHAGLRTWEAVLAAPERPNAEGFVVTRMSDGAMVKVKYEDYKRLHKYMTRINERHVWETLLAGRDLKEEFAGAPDEFHIWINQVADNLRKQYAMLEDTYTTAYGATLQLLPPEYTRKDFAEFAVTSKYSSALFLLEDKRPLNDLIWKKIKPEGGRTFKVVSSDAD